MTKQDVVILRARRSELSDQLESATGRRRSLAEQVRRADGASKAGLESRLAVLDQRIVRLGADIDQTGQQLASPQAQQFAETRAAPRRSRPRGWSGSSRRSTRSRSKWSGSPRGSGS